MLQPNATIYIKNIDWKVKKPLLRRALYSLFSRHGKVLEVITLRRDGLRGQAWIIFDEAASATAALQAEQGFTLFGRDLVLSYARVTSDRISKRDGTYVPKAKRVKLEDTRKVEEEAAATAADAPRDNNKEEKLPPIDNSLPSKYLLAQDLPSDCNQMALQILFRQYAGFKEVRMPRPGLAFVEFDDEPHATLAKTGLHGFALSPTDKLILTYGKS